MGLFNRNKSQPESGIAVFQGWMTEAHHLSRDKLKSVEQKRAALSDHLDTLDEALFTEYFPLIVGMVQSSWKNCEPFKNTDAQVANICSWLKRMNDNRELLTLFIKERRENYGLEV